MKEMVEIEPTWERKFAALVGEGKARIEAIEKERHRLDAERTTIKEVLDMLGVAGAKEKVVKAAKGKAKKPAKAEISETGEKDGRPFVRDSAGYRCYLNPEVLRRLRGLGKFERKDAVQIVKEVCPGYASSTLWTVARSYICYLLLEGELRRVRRGRYARIVPGPAAVSGPAADEDENEDFEESEAAEPAPFEDE